MFQDRSDVVFHESDWQDTVLLWVATRDISSMSSTSGLHNWLLCALACGYQSGSHSIAGAISNLTQELDIPCSVDRTRLCRRHRQARSFFQCVRRLLAQRWVSSVTVISRQTVVCVSPWCCVYCLYYCQTGFHNSVDGQRDFDQASQKTNKPICPSPFCKLLANTDFWRKCGFENKYAKTDQYIIYLDSVARSTDHTVEPRSTEHKFRFQNIILYWWSNGLCIVQDGAGGSWPLMGDWW